VSTIIVLSILIILAMIVDGFRHGVIQRALETIGFIAIFIFASRLADWVEPVLSKNLAATPKIAFFGSWAIVLVGGVILVRISSAAFASLMKFSIVGTIDRIGGMVMGLLFGCLLVSVLLVGMIAVTDSPRLRSEIQDHPVTGPLLRVAPEVYDVAAKAWNGQGFFKMIQERLEPLSQETIDTLKAHVSQYAKDGKKEK